MLVKMKKTLIQSDFDGTITQEDVSFMLLDAFSDNDWRPLLREYRENRISVNSFNSRLRIARIIFPWYEGSKIACMLFWLILSKFKNCFVRMELCLDLQNLRLDI